MFGVFVPVLAGCGGSVGTSTAPAAQGSMPPPTAMPSDQPPVPSAAWQGRFVGTVKIGDVKYFGDALLTVDGQVRLYIGGPYSADGALPTSLPDGSAQFVGMVKGDKNTAAGSGVLIGQGCSAPHLVRFCDGPATGAISVPVDSKGDIGGELTVTAAGATEVWPLDLHPWNNYYLTSASQIHGTFKEQLAEFATNGDTIVTIDAAGLLQFQSPRSACTGNGSLTPHLDGQFDVFDVSLVIDHCIAPYIYLNGDYKGLATDSPSDYWNYDDVLRLWVSQPADAASPAALMMSELPQ